MTHWQDEYTQSNANLCQIAAYGSFQQPVTARHAVHSSFGLVKRLKPSEFYQGHCGSVNALDWNAAGDLLISGGDDCRVKIWSTDNGTAMHAFDSGHTSSIYATKFMPDTGNEQIITSAADRQIRHVNLQRNAIKPYCCHNGKVRALVPLGQNIFISGSDDGTARHVDLREPSSACDTPGLRTGDIIACQQQERNGTPRGKAKLGINAIAVDPLRPHLFVTGSMDPLVRLYDRRMHASRLPGQNSPGSKWPMWVSCYVPATFKTRSQELGADRMPFLTSVKFSASGNQIFASYSGDHIYSFDTATHARESHSFCVAQGWHRSRPSSATRSASRHAVLQTAAPETAPGASALPYATSAIALQRTASANPVPRPLSGASEHQAGSSNSAGSGEASLRSGGLSEAAAAAVAQIRRRRATAQNTQAASQGMPTAVPGNGSTEHASATTASLVNANAFDMPARNPVPRDHGSADSNAASIGRTLHRSLTGQSIAHGATAAAARHHETAFTEDQQAVAQPPTVPSDLINEPVSRSMEAPAASGPATELGRAHGPNRPPLPCSATRRSARLHKAAAESPPHQLQQDMPDARAAAASSPHSSVQGSAAGTRPVTRHACKRKLAEVTDASNAGSPGSSRASGAIQPNMPAPQRMQHTRRAAGAPDNAVLCAGPSGNAAGAALYPTTACAEGTDGQTQVQNEPAAWHGPLHMEDTLLGRHNRSAIMPGMRHASAAYPLTRHLLQVPRTTLAAPSHSQQPTSTGQAAAGMRPEQAQQQQHLQPDNSLHTELGEAVVGSTQRFEQPTASTGTSRPDPRWFHGGSMQMPQGGPRALIPPADFLRLRYSTEPPISASNSRENSPDEAQQASQQPMQASDANHPGPMRQPRQLRSSRLAPQAAADQTAAPSAHSTEAAKAATSAGPNLLLGDAPGATAAGSQPREDTGAGPAASNVANEQQCDKQGCSELDPRDQPRECTPASSICRQTTAQGRGRASVEASTQGVRRQRSSSTVNTLHEASTKRSQDHSTQLDACCDEDLPMQSAQVSTDPQQALLSPSSSTHASLPNPNHNGRLLLASDAHSCEEGNACHQGDMSSTAQQQLDQESHAGNATPGAGRSPDMYPRAEDTQAGALAPAPDRPQWLHGSSAQLHQHSRQTGQSASDVPPPEPAPSHDSLLQSRSTSILGSDHSEAHGDVPGLYEEPGLVGGDPDQPQAQQGNSRPQSPRPVDSFVGAIVHGGSPDQDDGEVVEERGMFQQCYKGHCNLSHNKELCLMGSRDAFVVSGSDDGWIFIWDRHTGQLVNMLHADDRNVCTVAANPHMPILASSGADSVVKCWAPQAEEPCKLDRAAAVMASNARELAEGDQRGNIGAPPMWLNMLGTAVHAELAGQEDAAAARGQNPVRCTIM